MIPLYTATATAMGAAMAIRVPTMERSMSHC